MSRGFPCALLVTAALLAGVERNVALAGDEAGGSGRLRGSHRFDKDGWTYVHIEGPPERLGYQHGYLLTAEINDFLRVLKPYLEKSTKRDWNFYRPAAEMMLWIGIDPEYQREIDGIVEGLIAKGVKADRWDLVAISPSTIPSISR